MLVVTAHITVDPGRITEFEALARELWAATHRREPGCRRYEYVRLRERGAFFALMVFDDHEAFLTHQASEHHTRIAAGPMRELVLSVDLRFGAPMAGAFGGVERADADEPAVDPSLREHYRERYPPPDFGAWES